MNGFTARRLLGIGFALALVSAALPASAQVYRCKNAAGGTEFQATPCGGAAKGEQVEVRPASGAAPARAVDITPVKQTPDAPATDGGSAMAGNMKKHLAKLESERLKREADQAVDDKRNQITAQRQQCAARIDAVRAQKSRAANNLAGATWEGAISQEMQSLAAQCESESRILQSDLDDLRRVAAERGREVVR
ncbi:DUF4124 domain-containing protein [Variovorax sp. GT1P44]|uniref:DUF4124 domain-containing protein n=1 Tax=Variovorax sp. GT1P44 TaxID=3443742 RepID=UPI003F4701D4